MSENRKNLRDQFPSHFFKRFAPETRPVVTRMCEHAGCTQRGEHKAPLRHYREEQRASPLNIINEGAQEAHRWFCLDHVKEYNAHWDYYEGLDTHEIEAAIRFDTVWNRPSWPFGQWGQRAREAAHAEQKKSSTAPDSEAEKSDELFRQMDEVARSALAELGLAPPVEFTAVKKRYRELVKRHHPDVQGGEENDTITRLNAAFTVLKALYLKHKAS